ncbi:YciI family protein [Marinicella sp. W31]|uniref:YciI family protein n=1 Tax=Marinicella sp. W31 TaxID=3023713 RepID=UPI003757DF1B
MSHANEYDNVLAEKLGADEYGMKTYVMAMLKKGPNRNQTPEEAAELQRAHMDNIGRMAQAGQLVLAGPFMPNDDGLQGIYIFNVDSVEKAKALTETDPAVKAGRLVMELYPWYGSAALMLVNEEHKKVAKKDH